MSLVSQIQRGPAPGDHVPRGGWGGETRSRSGARQWSAVTASCQINGRQLRGTAAAVIMQWCAPAAPAPPGSWTLQSGPGPWRGGQGGLHDMTELAVS